MTHMVYGTVVAPVSREERVGKWWHSIDRVSLFAIFFLFGIGLLLGMAGSPPLALRNGHWEFHYVVRQLAFGMIALATMIVISNFEPIWIRRAGVLGFLLCLIILILLPVIGTDYGKGATRWISLGFASVQPSEFLKPGFVVTMAWLISASKDIGGPPGRTLATLFTVFITLVLALQPDYGQAALILGAWGVMMYVGGMSYKAIALVGVLVVVGMNFAYTHSEHVANRLNDFLRKGELDPTTQLGIAANAVRNGGFTGVGIGEGTVKFSLPDAHTDFIIAVAAEEYGVLACWVIIATFGVIVLRSLFRLMNEQDMFIRLTGLGLTSIIAAQSTINLAVTARIAPAKGMTLPFVSYGGSSLVATGITFGFLLALTRQRPNDEYSQYLAQSSAARSRK